MCLGSKVCRNEDLETDEEAERGTERVKTVGEGGEVSGWREYDDDDCGMEITFSMLRTFAGLLVGIGMLRREDIMAARRKQID